MSFCKNCGAQLDDAQNFCNVCGTPVQADNTQQQQQPAGQTYSQQTPPIQQQAAPQTPPPFQQAQPSYNNPNGYTVPSNAMPMKWYKFLTNFALFAGAVGLIIYAILLMTGQIYNAREDGMADLVYMFFPSMKTVNIIFGIASLAMAAYYVYVRFRLSGYKSNGPSLLLGCYVLGSAVSIIYAIATYIVLSRSPYGIDVNAIANNTNLIPTLIGNIIGSVIMIVLNKIYFDKRKHLFVNN